MKVDCAMNTETHDTHQKCCPRCSRCSVYRQSSYTHRTIQARADAYTAAEQSAERTWPIPPRRTKFPVSRRPHSATIATSARFRSVLVVSCSVEVATSQAAWAGGHEDQMKSTCIQSAPTAMVRQPASTW